MPAEEGDLEVLLLCVFKVTKDIGIHQCAYKEILASEDTSHQLHINFAIDIFKFKFNYLVKHVQLAQRICFISSQLLLYFRCKLKAAFHI